MKMISFAITTATFFFASISMSYGQEGPETTKVKSEQAGLTITTDGVTSNTAEQDSSETDIGTSEGEQNMGSAYVCSQNGLQRRIEIDLLSAPAPVPCEVNYYKDNEDPGIKATLWSAINDSQYCENQAKVFVEKLQSMNWSCSGG